MKTVIDGRLLDVRKTGGTQYTRRLIESMSELSSQDEFLVMRAGPEPLFAQAANVHEVIVPEAQLGDEQWEQLRLPILLRNLRPDVYFAPTSILPMIRCCPMVTVVYDLGFLQHPEFYAPTLRRYLRQWLPASARRADAVVCLAQSVREETVGTFSLNPDTVHVVPGAPDEALRRPLPPEQLEQLCQGLELTRPFVLCVSSSEPNKNLPRLIAAYGQAQADVTERWQLVLAGPAGADEPRVQEAITRLPAGTSVLRLGFVPDEALAALYRACEVFAFVSLFEGFGLPVLEAMAAQRSVVCSNTGPVAEVAGNAAAAVDPMNTGEIAIALRGLMADDRARATLSTRAGERAAAFSWRRSGERLLRILQRTVSGSSRPV